MNKFVLLLIFISLSTLASSELSPKKLVLLTSLKHERIPIEYNLAVIFKNKFRHWKFPVEIEIIHEADQEILHRELMDGTNDGVFWVSHGSFTKMKKNNDTGGLSVKPWIFDYRKDNVAEIFSLVHPNIQYLAIVGCNTKSILDYYSYGENSNLNQNLHSFVAKRKVAAQISLKKSIRKFKRLWKKNLLKKSPMPKAKESYVIDIERFIPTNAPEDKIRPLRVMNGNKLLGVVPKAKPGNYGKIIVGIPKISPFAKHQLRLEFSTGESIYTDETDIHFGDIDVSSNDEFSWDVFAKPNGQPFGVNSRIFNFTAADTRYLNVELLNLFN